MSNAEDGKLTTKTLSDLWKQSYTPMPPEENWGSFEYTGPTLIYNNEGDIHFLSKGDIVKAPPSIIGMHPVRLDANNPLNCTTPNTEPPIFIVEAENLKPFTEEPHSSVKQTQDAEEHSAEASLQEPMSALG